LKEDASSSSYQSLNCLCFFHPWLVEKEEEFLVFFVESCIFFSLFPLGRKSQSWWSRLVMAEVPAPASASARQSSWPIYLYVPNLIGTLPPPLYCNELQMKRDAAGAAATPPACLLEREREREQENRS
jgi:hypothetical protein